MAKGSTNKKLMALAGRLNAGRAAVYVSSIAFDHGETDLELQSAATLKAAFESINEVYDELMSICNRSRFRKAKEVANG